MSEGCLITRKGEDRGVQVFYDGMPAFAAVNLADIIRRDGPGFAMVTLYATGDWRSISPNGQCDDDPRGNVEGYGSFFSGEPRGLFSRRRSPNCEFYYDVDPSGMIDVFAVRPGLYSRNGAEVLLGKIDPFSDNVVDDLVGVVFAAADYPLDTDDLHCLYSKRFSLSPAEHRKRGAAIRPAVIDKFASLGWFDVVEFLLSEIDINDLDHDDPFRHSYNAYLAGVPAQDIFV